MIRVSVVDNTGESRARLVDTIDSYLRSGLKEASLLPRVSVRPVSPQEIKFAAAPDICIVGPSLIEGDLTEIAKIKALLPNTPVIVQLSDVLNTLSVVEQLANLGADDLLSPVTGAHEFLRKLILLSRKAKMRANGRLIVVDGGKGGVGVTSMVAALGEAYLTQGRRVALIDLDFESQDLSRFLQARPFVNENLRSLLDEERPVTEETVLQTVSRVWQNEENLVCVPPVAESDDLFDSQTDFHRMYVSVIELLDQQFDLIIVDLGAAHGVLKRAFYRIADSILFVVSNDAASVYASVEKFQKIRGSVGATCQVRVVENDICAFGLSPSVVRDEFLRAARMDDSVWFSKVVPFCKLGLRWPGSGGTLFSAAKSQIRESIVALAKEIGGVTVEKAEGSKLNFFKKWSERFSNRSELARATPPERLRELPSPAIQLSGPMGSPTATPQISSSDANIVPLSNYNLEKKKEDDWEPVSPKFVSGVK